MIRQGRGEAIILLHGWGMNSIVFNRFSAELAKTREVIRVELPGYGASVWDETLTFSQQVEQIVAELPEGEILGWSMGGLYAVEMLRQQPQQFSRLLLVCFNPCFVRRTDWHCAVESTRFDQFATSLTQSWEATVRHFLSLQLYANLHARRLVRELMADLQQVGRPDPAALKFGLELLKQQDVRPLLSTLDTPIQLILGRRDRLVPESLAKEIRHVNPKIKVELLATAAHMPFLSDTAHFLTML